MNKVWPHLLVSGSSPDTLMFLLVSRANALELGRSSRTTNPALYLDPPGRPSLAHCLPWMSVARKIFFNTLLVMLSASSQMLSLVLLIS